MTAPCQEDGLVAGYSWSQEHCAGANGAGFHGLAVVWEGVKSDQSCFYSRGFPAVAVSRGLSLSAESCSCTLGWVCDSARLVCGRDCDR